MRALLAAILFAVGAAAVVGKCYGQDWLVVNGLAKHLDGQLHCNSTTSGLGYEREHTRALRTTVGFYRNSNCRWSAYVAEAWTPIDLGLVRAGVLGGIVTGYTAAVMPAGGLALSIEGHTFGANVIFIPPYKDSGNVLWLQAKVRW